MPQAVVAGASVKCSYGTACPSLLVSSKKVKMGDKPCANIFESAAIKNIPNFGMCSSPLNPAVAAAMPLPPPGTIKPQPCTPMLVGDPWIGDSPKVKVEDMPCLTTQGQLLCKYGGQIGFMSAGQAKVNVG